MAEQYACALCTYGIGQSHTCGETAMSVDNWARREAERNWPSIQPTSPSGLTLPGKNYRGSEIDLVS